MEATKKAGIIIDYKVFSATPQSPDHPVSFCGSLIKTWRHWIEVSRRSNRKKVILAPNVRTRPEWAGMNTEKFCAENIFVNLFKVKLLYMLKSALHLFIESHSDARYRETLRPKVVTTKEPLRYDFNILHSRRDWSAKGAVSNLSWRRQIQFKIKRI